jgi:hypothetical protein
MGFCQQMGVSCLFEDFFELVTMKSRIVGILSKVNEDLPQKVVDPNWLRELESDERN